MNPDEYSVQNMYYFSFFIEKFKVWVISLQNLKFTIWLRQ